MSRIETKKYISHFSKITDPIASMTASLLKALSNMRFSPSPSPTLVDKNISTISVSPEINPPLRICRQRDVTELNQCLRGALEEIKPRIAKGIPELGLAGVDPLRLQHLVFNHGSGPVSISSQFTDVEVTGLSKFNKSDFWYIQF